MSRFSYFLRLFIMLRILKATFGVAIATFGVAHADFSGIVSHVSDGDTIKVQDRCSNVRTVRMLGIDAPEKAQEYGKESKSALSALVAGRRVKIISSKRDKYGRDVGKVLLGKADINLLQVQAGNAWHYVYYAQDQPVKDRSAYGAAEAAAKVAKSGLWAAEVQEPPWEWRRR